MGYCQIRYTGNMKKLLLLTFMMGYGCIPVPAQRSIGLNLGVLPFQNLMVTYEHAGPHAGIRPFILVPLGGKDKLGGGIDLRLYTRPIKPVVRFYGGISLGCWRTNEYETPYKALGANVLTIYSGFLCAGMNINTEKLVISIGGAAGASSWKLAGTHYEYFNWRPEVGLAIKI